MTVKSISFLKATFLFFLSGLIVQARTQDAIKFQSYTSEQGLSENVIYCQMIDSRGFLWVGTDFGLNRFDGYRFRQFLKKNDDVNSLSHNGIVSIAEDARHRIWVITFQSVERIDGLTGKVTRIKSANLPEPDGTRLLDIVRADSQHMLIVKQHAVFLLHTDSLNLTKLSDTDSTEIFPRFFRTNQNEILIAGSTRKKPVVFRYNTRNKKLDKLMLRSFLPFLRDRGIRYFYQDATGYTYIKYQGSGPICIYDVKGKEIYDSNFDPVFRDSAISQIYSALDLGDDEVWLATSMGLRVFNRRRKQVDGVKLNGDGKVGTTIPDIRSLSRNRQGVVWLGTFGEGLLKCIRAASAFRNMLLPDYHKDRSNNLIFGLYTVPDQPGVIAAERGFSGLNLIYNHRTFKTLSKREIDLEQSVMLTTGKKFSDLSSFLQTKIAEVFSARKLIVYQYKIPDDSTLMYEWHSDVFIVQPNRQFSINVGGYCKIVDCKNEIWIASNNGLFLLEKKDYQQKQYIHESDNTCSLAENYLYTVLPDSANNVWVGTKGGGLNYFDRKAGCFVKYTTEHGLPDNVIYAVLKDNSGNLWLTTNRGLSRFNPSSGQFTNFSRRDGLINMEFNRQGAIQLGDTLYFSGTVGIDYFNPKDIEEANHAPEVYLSEIFSGNQEITYEASKTEKIIFPYNRNNLSIRFTTNDFVRPELVYFRYRIYDMDRWTRVVGENNISYAYLAPGNYVFSVQASYNNQIWGEIRQLVFSVREPWWNTLWFYMLASFLVVAVLTIIYRYRITQIRKLFSIRNRISRDLHDEVGATLSSIHVYSAVASNVLMHDQNKAREALEQIGRNSRKVMESMNDIIWAINPVEMNGSTFESKLKDFGYEILAPVNIICSYTIDPETEKKLINIDARRNLLMIAREAMYNASRHSGCTSVEIFLGSDYRNIRFEIIDNGKGFGSLVKKSGNGLRNMRLRCEFLGGRFFIESQTGIGTAIRCIIPVTRISDQR